ncbi:MAG: 4'-phosphopantetheinyl transferase superfamily protein [Arenimonas sp.]|nr:4'-phosphopantetheinyl transferase superfamily protein [Arenimonas sp.]
MNQAMVRVGNVDALAGAALLAGESWLTGREHTRMLAISAPQRRRQFLAGHWLARLLAAQACGGEPGQWRLDTGDDPRPRLHCSGRPGLWASLSHSGPDVAAGVAHQAIGLDLEQSSRERDLVALAHFVLAPEEARQVAGHAPGPDQRACFHRLWTLKEAHGKRSGEGLQPTKARRVAARPSAEAEAEAWHWPLPGSGSLAVAAWPGLQVSLDGADVIASTWRYHPLP